MFQVFKTYGNDDSGFDFEKGEGAWIVTDGQLNKLAIIRALYPDSKSSKDLSVIAVHNDDVQKGPGNVATNLYDVIENAIKAGMGNKKPAVTADVAMEYWERIFQSEDFYDTADFLVDKVAFFVKEYYEGKRMRALSDASTYERLIDNWGEW